MKKRHKQVLEVLVVVLVIGGISAAFLLTSESPDETGDAYSWSTDPNRLSMPETKENLTLIVDYKNGTVDTFEKIDLNNHYTTVFDLVNKCCTINDYDIYNWDPKSFFINSINGRSGDWVYEVNDVSIPAASNVVSPANDSVVYWEYIS